MNKKKENNLLKMKHQYLTDAGIEIETTGYNSYSDTGRDSSWENDRAIYGFDEREVWDLTDTFVYWAYERIQMFNERKGINCNCEFIIINNKKNTLQYGIDLFISLCEEYFDNTKIFNREALKKGDILYSEILSVFQCIIGNLNY